MPIHVARISYGKDSLKMLDVIVSRGLPLDRITTSDVWATDTIPASLPPVEEFKSKMDEIIWKKYRIEVEHLCARNKDGTKKTYEQMFYHVPERKSAPPERRIWGFPHIRAQWCKELKTKIREISARDDKGVPVGNGSQLVSKAQAYQGFSDKSETTDDDKDIVEYIGIAADEPKRFGQLNEKKRAPLAEFDIDEGLCGLYCQYGDMLSPSYESSCRDGCWFCHNQGVDQLRLLRRNYPEYWNLLLKWDKDSPVTFKADGHTVHDFDYRFQCEDEGLIQQDRTFRWNMLEAVQLKFNF